MGAMNSLTVTFFTLCLLNRWVHSTPIILNRGKAIGILPVITCPDDLPDAVVVAPSVPGVPDLAANQYIVCIQGEPLIFNCSEGLFFNWSIMSCDIPYERSSSSSNNNGTTSAEGDLDLIPAGPIQVPISPELPVPIWTRGGSASGANGVQVPSIPVINPVPVHPITKPNPVFLPPIPVLPAHPPPLIPRPVPYLP